MKFILAENSEIHEILSNHFYPFSSNLAHFGNCRQCHCLRSFLTLKGNFWGYFRTFGNKENSIIAFDLSSPKTFSQVTKYIKFWRVILSRFMPEFIIFDFKYAIWPWEIGLFGIKLTSIHSWKQTCDQVELDLTSFVK